jgi:hypothetical protein
MKKLMWSITCCFAVFNTMLFPVDVSTVTVYAGGTNCTGPLGLNPFAQGTLLGPFLLPSGGHKYEEKNSHELMCAPQDGTKNF